MKKPERLAMLAAQLKAEGVLHLKQAAERLGVSEMTVRRDLAAAPDTFHYLGGYILAPQTERDGLYRLDKENDEHAEAKDAACRRVAALIAPGDTIFLDCGTTTPHLIAYLPTEVPLTVVCYSLNIANRLAQRPNIRMILLGGLFHPAAQTFSGDEAIHAMEHLRINHAILSAGGVHDQQGVTCSNFNEVPIKQIAMQRALRKTLVIDSSKLRTVRPAFFAKISQFDEIVTENGLLPRASHQGA
ncbi:DeoR/GlpR family DNA-binding transcription regulator [Tianweitania populi]|uniref:DeoR/GlpR family DNA-binding transcription regulator n=1 Tax=Tianweitania populi TaxID=1607949 RepID=UPI001FCF17E3|nr:DeoR/GlpR family DNA-binding transcription regulator [Tianweitania populi]